MSLILSIIALVFSIGSMSVSLMAWKMVKEISPTLDRIILSLDSLHEEINRVLSNVK